LSALSSTKKERFSSPKTNLISSCKNEKFHDSPNAGMTTQKTMKLLPPALALLLVAASASAVTLTGMIRSHDPSRMIACNGKYYVCSTGGRMKVSTDRLAWSEGTSPFPNGVPPSLKALFPQNHGIWAPDIIFCNNQYCLYYSVAGADGKKCAIGLLTSPTLDPAVPGYGWKDAGVVIATDDKVEKKSAIDPAPFFDATGNLWLAWGSGYGNGATWNDPTIFISRMDKATGLRSSADPKYYPVAPGHIEASYVHCHGGYYYAFWNDGGCCNGVKSTYRILMARSRAVTGPWVNRAGTAGAHETFLASHDDVHGPGHMGVLSEGGVDWFTYHYYGADGKPVLGEQQLAWGADGWPAAGQ
jgi:beta-xylosidase